jgi:hypothetical protein
VGQCRECYLLSYQDVIHQLGYGEFITETFTYTVVDQGDLTATSKLIVHVLGQNDPITAFNDTASVNEDTWLRYNVCENDSDIDFDWQGNIRLFYINYNYIASTWIGFAKQCNG